MLFTGEQIYNIFCVTVKIPKSKNTTLNCTYAPGHDFDAVLYDSVLGLLFTILFMLLHIAFYFLNQFIGKDFVKCFATSAIIPLSAGLVALFIQILLSVILNPTYWIVEVFNHLHAVCLTTSFFTALIGLAVFIFAHVFVLCTGKAPDMEDSWSIYFTVQIIGWILSGCAHFASTNYKRLPTFALLILMIIAIVMIFFGLISSAVSIIFCGKRRHISNDPVVKNAFLRIIFASGTLLWLIPTGLAVYLLQQDATVVGDIDEESVLKAVQLFYSERLLEFFASPFLILPLLALPTYREALISAVTFKGRSRQWAQKTGKIPAAGSPLITGRQQIFPSQPGMKMDDVKIV